MKRGMDYARPRRPDPETVTYLRSLPLDLKVATEEISQFLQQNESNQKEEEEEFPQSFAAAFSALDEVQNEVASLAGHEESAEMIEVITRLAAPHSETAARMLLQAVSGYALHLATHRYGSHVLQTILELSVRKSEPSSPQDLAKHAAAPPLSSDNNNNNNSLPSLEQLLVNLQQELAPHAADLSVHICGAHVLRTLLCVLAGVELQYNNKQDNSNNNNVFRRGKKKTKKTSSKSNIINRNNTSNTYHMVLVPPDKIRIQINDPAIEEALEQLVSAISGDTVPEAPGYLQEMACHSSCGPLLSVLLRVLTYQQADRIEWIQKLQKYDKEAQSGVDRHLALVRDEPKFTVGSPAHQLVQRLLCWQDRIQEQKWAGQVIYGLAGEQRGSHCLETILHVAPDDLYESILRAGDLLSSSSSSATTLQEYIKDTVSNFVIQTMLGTLRNKEQAQTIIGCLQPAVESGYIVGTDNHRLSLLWRMVECAVKYKVCQEQLHSSILKGFSKATGRTDLYSTKDCVPLLLGLRKPEKYGDRVFLDVAGVRTLFWLLRYEPRLCEPILSGILKLPADELELLCTDGLGSRCIVDGILDGPVEEEKVFSKALTRITTKLSGRWTALASDRIGHHVVMKLFRNLKSPESRETLVKELVDGKRRMTGNRMSREVMTACLVREYETHGSAEWHRLVKKTLEKEDWLKDIIPEKTGKDAKADNATGKRKKRDRTDSLKKARSG